MIGVLPVQSSRITAVATVPPPDALLAARRPASAGAVLRLLVPGLSGRSRRGIVRLIDRGRRRCGELQRRDRKTAKDQFNSEIRSAVEKVVRAADGRKRPRVRDPRGRARSNLLRREDTGRRRDGFDVQGVRGRDRDQVRSRMKHEIVRGRGDPCFATHPIDLHSGHFVDPPKMCDAP